MIHCKSVLKNKLYLYVTEFFSGMSVMAVELGASRLLAPYFSSSQIVWTIIIGTIMIAMAAGNVYGGRSADKNPNPDRLYKRLIISAIWIAAIPVVGKYVILGISGLLIFSVSSYFLIWAAFAACMVIFVYPLFLLGTVTPSLAKYTVESLEENGKIVGNLGAANTIGSIIGTFLPTFVTIPAVGTSVTFLIFSGILLVIALIYFINKKSSAKKIIAAVLVFVLCSVFGHENNFAFWETNLSYEGESVYNYLQVKENDDSVIFSTNVLFGVQSILKKSEGLTGMYYDYALAAPFMAGVCDRDNLDILILGMGTGTYALQCDKYFENASVEGVEIDEKITSLTKRYFSLPENIDVTTYDGRAFLNAVDKKYDIIMVDAYQDITIPFQMSSVEFFSLVKGHLNDGGVMVMNMNMRGGDGGGINSYLGDTVCAVFSEVYTVNVEDSTNQELFASNSPEMLDVMKNNIDKLEQKIDEKNLYTSNASIVNTRNYELARMMTRVYNAIKPYERGNRLMTDDKAPVELLGMQVIDTLIEEETDYYKKIYKKEGLKGLIDRLF